MLQALTSPRSTPTIVSRQTLYDPPHPPPPPYEWTEQPVARPIAPSAHHQPMLHAYTDGSVSYDGQYGSGALRIRRVGCAVIVPFQDHADIYQCLLPDRLATQPPGRGLSKTSDTAELWAALHAIQVLPPDQELTIHSDVPIAFDERHHKTSYRELAVTFQTLMERRTARVTFRLLPVAERNVSYHRLAHFYANKGLPALMGREPRHLVLQYTYKFRLYLGGQATFGGFLKYLKSAQPVPEPPPAVPQPSLFEDFSLI